MEGSALPAPSIIKSHSEEEPVDDSKGQNSSTTSSGGALGQKQLHESLTTLGRNGHGLLVFTQANLNRQSLRSIDLLRSYRYLECLHLDGNRLTSLQALKSLSALVVLSVSGNQLTAEDIFPHLRASIPTLERLNISNNGLTSLCGLSAHTSLRDLDMSRNALDVLQQSDFKGLIRLTRLTAQSSKITAVEADAFSQCCVLRFLDMSKNFLSDISWMEPLRNSLTVLRLAQNSVTSLQPLSSFVQLCTLNVARNAIDYSPSEDDADEAGTAADVNQRLMWVTSVVGCLSQLSFLRSLRMDGNPLDNRFRAGETSVVRDMGNFSITDESAGGDDGSAASPPIVPSTRSSYSDAVADDNCFGQHTSVHEVVSVTTAASLTGLADSTTAAQEHASALLASSARVVAEVCPTRGVTGYAMSVKRDREWLAALPNAPRVLAPEQEDAVTLSSLPPPTQRRLMVLLSVPQLITLDDRDVTPTEVVDAQTLCGGVNRTLRDTQQNRIQLDSHFAASADSSAVDNSHAVSRAAIPAVSYIRSVRAAHAATGPPHQGFAATQ